MLVKPRFALWTLTSLFFAPLVLTASSQELTWENLEDRLLQEEKGGFAGAVLVVRDSETVIDRGYGLANREKNIPNRSDTIFAVGSTPIDFTHVAILLLEERGKLSIRDRIENFFDDVPDDKYRITIDHLMTGGSGLQNFHDIPSDRDPDHHYIDRDEAVRRILDQELLFAPGNGREHSHSAWGLLAAIVEIASGESYRDFVGQNLLIPAGMNDTAYNGDAIPENRLAIGYGYRSDGEINAPPYWGPASWLVMGSGGMVSTTGDMVRWHQALHRGALLSEEATARYFGPPGNVGVGGDAYGFEITYTQGPGTLMVLISNANTAERNAPNRALAETLAALANDEVVAAAPPRSGQASFPDTPQGEHARSFFDAYASGEPNQYVQFGHEHRIPVSDQESADTARAAQFEEFRLMWDDLEVVDVDEFGDTIRIIAKKGSDDEHLAFSFRFEGDSPFRITSLTIDQASDPEGSSHEGHDNEEPWGDLDDLLQRAKAKHGIPALAVTITRGGVIVGSAATGERKQGEARKVSVNDRFHWGSIGKSVTGTVIGKLIEEGVMEPVLTLFDAFPDFEIHADYRDVTIEQLMCHRGGVPPFTEGVEIFQETDPTLDRITARSTFTELVLSRPPVGRPGVTHRYSNAGIAIAAHAAEALTGKTWEELVRTHCFDPAGMTTAGFGWPRDVGADQPSGHRLANGALQVVPESEMPFNPALYAAGNIHSSIEDVGRYMILHLDGLNGRDGHLRSETMRSIHQPLPGPGEPYAFGWAIERWPDADTECHWHNGSGGTFFAEVKLLPEEDLGIAVMMNAYLPDSDVANEIAEALVRRLRDGD